jgi:hypothetical protein
MVMTAGAEGKACFRQATGAMTITRPATMTVRTPVQLTDGYDSVISPATQD